MWLSLVVVLAASSTRGHPVRTLDEVRIDREIGDNNGWVDARETAVARASWLVYRSTGMNIRPQLVYRARGFAGLTFRDSYDGGARVYISRTESLATIMFTVFHEAGHVAYRHDLGGSSRSAELWADEYAGRLVAATGANILAALLDVRRRGDTLHGSGKQRAAALWTGYRAAKRTSARKRRVR